MQLATRIDEPIRTSGAKTWRASAWNKAFLHLTIDPNHTSEAMTTARWSQKRGAGDLRQVDVAMVRLEPAHATNASIDFFPKLPSCGN
jgi:hypothetical protein